MTTKQSAKDRLQNLNNDGFGEAAAQATGSFVVIGRAAAQDDGVSLNIKISKLKYDKLKAMSVSSNNHALIEALVDFTVSKLIAGEEIKINL